MHEIIDTMPIQHPDILAPSLVLGGARPATLADAYAILRSKRFVDLTHPFLPGIPHWKAFGDEDRTMVFDYDQQGFRTHRYSFVGQWGTHVDPPAHFVASLRTLDQIDVREMILPLVVLDIHARVAHNPDAVVTLADVRAWEARHGMIPPGAFVALRTDWSNRWPDMSAMYNRDADGIDHFPGWSQAVLTYLCEVCAVTAIGHETIDTDPGVVSSQDEYPLERYILGQNRYQVELLAHLDQLPEAGGLIVVSFPKPCNGSGFPARAFAIVP